MKAKLVKILLDHDVIFTKEDPNFVNTKGYCLSGFSVMSQRVYGNSKEEVLQKMHEKQKAQNKQIKKYNQLPHKKDFIESILYKNKFSLKRKYTVRCTYKVSKMRLLTETRTGEEWLRDKWTIDYTEPVIGSEIFLSGGFKYNIMRNSLEVNWDLWSKYKDLVDKWESELKKDNV